MIFEELNKFNNVVFTEKGHSYTVGGRPAISVTTFLKKFKEPFNTDFWAEASAKKRSKTKQEILKEWDSKRELSTNKGSKFHAFAENYINNKVINTKKYDSHIDASAYNKIESQFINFYETTKDTLIPIRSELCVGSSHLGICGTIDQLYYSKNFKQLVIFDWKTNKKINQVSPYDNWMLNPISHLPECEFITYSLQLSLYKYIIELETNLQIHSCYIVWFNEKNQTYQTFKCDDFRKEIIDMLQYN
tara:strand:+ start:894 stop:1634 length:741 start_codon:yes stop_codon:yes gene_type:complete